MGPLTARERDRYCAEAAIMEPLLGMPAGAKPPAPRPVGDPFPGKS